MALLDAYALGRALQNTSTPEDAFSQYAKVRRLHVRLFQAASLTLTPFYQSDNRAMPWLRDILFEPVSKLPLADKLVASLGAGLMSDPVARIEAMKTDKH